MCEFASWEILLFILECKDHSLQPETQSELHDHHQPPKDEAGKWNKHFRLCSNSSQVGMSQDPYMDPEKAEERLPLIQLHFSTHSINKDLPVSNCERSFRHMSIVVLIIIKCGKTATLSTPQMTYQHLRHLASSNSSATTTCWSSSVLYTYTCKMPSCAHLCSWIPSKQTILLVLITLKHKDP